MKALHSSAVIASLLFVFPALAASDSTALGSQPPKACSTGPAGTVEHRWGPALKQAIGTSRSTESPVWFTVAENIITEVFYPRVDTPQVGDLQFIVTDGTAIFADQKNDTNSTVRILDDGMTVQMRGTQKSGLFTYQQEIVTDPARPVLRSRLRMKFVRPGMRAYLLFKPAIRNSGAGDRGSVSPEALVATESTRAECGEGTIRGTRAQATEPVFAALVPRTHFARVSAGWVGLDDGWQLLRKSFVLPFTRASIGPGNIALTGEIPASAISADGLTLDFDFALSFGPTQADATSRARDSLRATFDEVRTAYETGWTDWLETLARQSRHSSRVLSHSKMSRLSAAVLKMHEDKSSPGALVAALGKPSIPEGERAGDQNGGGYHLVWPRDLYHSAMGLLAVGDRETPANVLHYLIRTQRPDGSWAQNFWVDGTPYWTSLQMDEVSFPILLASKLEEHGLLQDQLRTAALEMIARAATFIEKNGPTSPQDRWEEVGGYIPSTLAAEIAALRAAARLGGSKLAPTASATAATWNANIENWTLSRRGPLGRQYYIRTSPSGNPDAREEYNLANGAGRAVAESIIDGGFLELVRLGVREADAPGILSTLTVYDDPGIAVASYADPSTGARGYRRYNRDFYGPGREGGYWPLLTGERGMHWLAFGDRERAAAHLELLEAMALPSGMIPEQVRTIATPADAGAGVACPLAWAHAEALVLNRSLVEGHLFDQPLAE